jgi:hypothetical protein
MILAAAKNVPRWPDSRLRRDADAEVSTWPVIARRTEDVHPCLRAIRNGLTRAPGNNAAIGGLKITTHGGWFADRPPGCDCERGARDRKQRPAVRTVILTRITGTRHGHRTC